MKTTGKFLGAWIFLVFSAKSSYGQKNQDTLLFSPPISKILNDTQSNIDDDRYGYIFKKNNWKAGTLNHRIDRNRIGQWGFVTLGEVLQFEPGIMVSRPGNYRDGELIMNNGMYFNQHGQIMIDGIALRDPNATSLPIYANLPILQAHSIDIWNTSQSHLLGQGTAAGAININIWETERPYSTQAYVNFQAGGNNSLSLIAQGKIGNNKNVLKFKFFGNYTENSKLKLTSYDAYYSDVYTMRNSTQFLDTLYYYNKNYRGTKSSPTLERNFQNRSSFTGINLTFRKFKFYYFRMFAADNYMSGQNPLAVQVFNSLSNLNYTNTIFNLSHTYTKNKRTVMRAVQWTAYKHESRTLLNNVIDHNDVDLYRMFHLLLDRTPSPNPVQTFKRLISDSSNLFTKQNRYEMRGVNFKYSKNVKREYKFITLNSGFWLQLGTTVPWQISSDKFTINLADSISYSIKLDENTMAFYFKGLMHGHEQIEFEKDKWKFSLTLAADYISQIWADLAPNYYNLVPSFEFYGSYRLTKRRLITAQIYSGAGNNIVGLTTEGRIYSLNQNRVQVQKYINNLQKPFNVMGFSIQHKAQVNHAAGNFIQIVGQIVRHTPNLVKGFNADSTQFTSQYVTSGSRRSYISFINHLRTVDISFNSFKLQIEINPTFTLFAREKNVVFQSQKRITDWATYGAKSQLNWNFKKFSFRIATVYYRNIYSRHEHTRKLREYRLLEFMSKYNLSKNFNISLRTTNLFNRDNAGIEMPYNPDFLQNNPQYSRSLIFGISYRIE